MSGEKKSGGQSSKIGTVGANKHRDLGGKIREWKGVLPSGQEIFQTNGGKGLNSEKLNESESSANQRRRRGIYPINTWYVGRECVP